MKLTNSEKMELLHLAVNLYRMEGNEKPLGDIYKELRDVVMEERE